jgi:hypothetical protein
MLIGIIDKNILIRRKNKLDKLVDKFEKDLITTCNYFKDICNILHQTTMPNYFKSVPYIYRPPRPNPLPPQHIPNDQRQHNLININNLINIINLMIINQNQLNLQF